MYAFKVTLNLPDDLAAIKNSLPEEALRKFVDVLEAMGHLTVEECLTLTICIGEE